MRAAREAIRLDESAGVARLRTKQGARNQMTDTAEVVLLAKADLQDVKTLEEYAALM